MRNGAKDSGLPCSNARTDDSLMGDHYGRRIGSSPLIKSFARVFANCLVERRDFFVHQPATSGSNVERRENFELFS